MPTMTALFLASQLAMITAYFTVDTIDLATIHSPLTYYYARNNDRPSWRCDQDKCAIVLPIHHLEADSIRLTLSGDGKQLALSGERKIEGCKCSPSEDVSVSLPFTPRVDDIHSSVDKAERLTVTIAKHAKTDDAEPISIKINKPEAAERDAQEKMKPLRFIPHASATEANIEEQAQTLSDKFREVAAVAVRAAVQTTTSDIEAGGNANGTANDTQGVA